MDTIILENLEVGEYVNFEHDVRIIMNGWLLKAENKKRGWSIGCKNFGLGAGFCVDFHRNFHFLCLLE